jgi:hypothetical protein
VTITRSKRVSRERLRLIFSSFQTQTHIVTEHARSSRGLNDDLQEPTNSWVLIWPFGLIGQARALGVLVFRSIVCCDCR